jgi:hypothetical protein
VLDLDHAGRLVERFPSQGPPERLFEHLKERGLAGPPEELAAGLERYAEAGVERMMLQHVVHEDLDVVSSLGKL